MVGISRIDLLVSIGQLNATPAFERREERSAFEVRLDQRMKLVMGKVAGLQGDRLIRGRTHALDGAKVERLAKGPDAPLSLAHC